MEDPFSDQEGFQLNSPKFQIFALTLGILVPLVVEGSQEGSYMLGELQYSHTCALF